MLPLTVEWMCSCYHVGALAHKCLPFCTMFQLFLVTIIMKGTKVQTLGARARAAAGACMFS